MVKYYVYGDGPSDHLANLLAKKYGNVLDRNSYQFEWSITFLAPAGESDTIKEICEKHKTSRGFLGGVRERWKMAER